MGLSSLKEQSTNTADSRSQRELFLDQLRAALPSLRESVNRIINEPTASLVRERLASDLRSLAGSASLMSYPLVAEELSICQSIVQASAILDELDAVDRIQLLESLDNVESVLSNEVQQEHTPTSWPVSNIDRDNLSVIAEKIRVVSCGGELLATSLRGVRDGLRFEVTEQSDFESARVHLRGVDSPPDVIVVDVDIHEAAEFVEWLFDQRNTEDVPVVAVGDLSDSTKVARYIALGVAATVAKPIRAGALRRACGEVAPLETPGKAEPLGLTTLDELGGRLASELHRGLCDAADDPIRQRMVDLGEGSDVLAIMWEAVRDIRDLLTMKSAGEMRFAKRIHGDALPREPWLDKAHKRPQDGRAMSPGFDSDSAEEVLDGMRILVAEDDPSTNWFLSGVVAEAGATTDDALDGEAALRRMYQQAPDLILCDVLLPGTDAWSLCRIIEDDPVLRGTPVILLSWKPDLLERMRELNVPAAGYLLKESKSATVMERVNEALRPRLGLSRRLRKGATVRGRLNDITPYALLALVGRERPDSRVTLRSGDDVFEVDVRGGVPVRVAHTDAQSQLHSGLGALATLLAMRSGRFGVDDFESCDPVVIDLEGSLAELAFDAVARLRATQRLLAPEILLRTERIELDVERLEHEIALTPGDGGLWLRALAEHASPAQLMAEHSAEIGALSRLLMAAARRGCVLRIINVDGDDMLPLALSYEERFLRGERVDSYYDKLCKETRSASMHTASSHDEPDISYQETDDAPEEWCEESEALTLAVASADPVGEANGIPAPAFTSEDDGEITADVAEPTPFLASRVSTGPLAAGAERDSVVERERWRDAIFAAADDGADEHQEEQPIQAAVADLEQSDESCREEVSNASDDADVANRVERLERMLEDEDSDEMLLRMRRRAEKRRRRRRRELAMLLDEEGLYDRDSVDELDELREAARAKARRQIALQSEADSDGPRVPRVPMPSLYATRGDSTLPPEPKSFASRFGMPLLFATLGIGLAVGARWMRTAPAVPATPTVQSKPAAVAAPVQPGAAASPPTAKAKVESPAGEKHSPDADEAIETPVELPLSKKDRKRLKRGEGLLEVVAGRQHKIFVDGRLIGRGPVKKIPLKAGEQRHEIRVKMKGEERVRYVVMRPGVRLRVRVAPPWSR